MYTIQTNHYQLSNGDGEKRHYSWSIGENEFRTRKTNFPMAVVGEITAWYEEQSTLLVSGVELTQLHDPWFIVDTTLSPESWVQPDEFRPLLELAADGSYQVFLYQNEYFDNDIPVYRLRAPDYYADANGIYEFLNWDGSSVIFQTPLTRETSVVFEAAGANVFPVYDLNNPVNLQVGAEIRIGEDDQIMIPPGATIEFAEGTTLIFESEYEFGGTESDPITLINSSGNDSQRWNGIKIEENVNLSYIRIEHTTIGLEIADSELEVNIETVDIIDTGIGVLVEDNEGGVLSFSNLNIAEVSDKGVKVISDYLGSIVFVDCSILSQIPI